MSNNIILDPTAPSGAGAQRRWKSLTTLQGKTVAFIDNSKPNFNHLAQDLGELLVKHHGTKQVIHHRKRDVKLNLWEMSKLPVDRLAAKVRMRLQRTRGAALGQFAADTRIPISIKPEEVGIIVASGPGTHSVHVPTFGHTRSVTKITN